MGSQQSRIRHPKRGHVGRQRNLDGNGNIAVAFTGTSPITSADTFDYGRGLSYPHFGFEGTSRPISTEVIDQYVLIGSPGADRS